MADTSFVQENPYPHPQAESVLNLAFGEGRLSRDVYHLRNTPPIHDLCWGIAQKDGNHQNLIALIRYWQIALDDANYADYRFLLLGPLAVTPAEKNKGYGRKLINHTIDVAKELKFDAIFVSGEVGYYQKLGFAQAPITAPTNTAPNQWHIYHLQQNSPIITKSIKLIAH